MPPPRRFFHFSYLGPYVKVPPNIHVLRDGDAFVELASLLHEQEYKYHGLILNYPQPDPVFEWSGLKETDLLVLTTRPPLHDRLQGSKKVVRRSKTKLERKILNTLEEFFDCCSRERITLTEKYAERLTHSSRSDIAFHVFQDKEHEGHKSRYKQYRNVYAGKNDEDHTWHFPERPTTTAAYAILTKIENGPMLLNAFGMDGQITLVWCHLLRTKYAALLKSPIFIMAEIEADPRPLRPATLSYAEDWNVSLMLQCDLSEAKKK